MKKEQGSITVITLVTILFMLSFLISTFVIISNRRQAQAEIKRETKGIYEEEIEDAEEIYQSYFANANDTIPIYTAEELFQISTGKRIVINNKIYTLDSSANYILMNNINFKVTDYQTEYSSLFSQKTWTKTNSTTGATETVTSTVWTTIEEQKINGTLIGIFDYNGKTITETDSENNIIIHEAQQ